MLLHALRAETLCVLAALMVMLIEGSPYDGAVRFTLIVLLALGDRPWTRPVVRK